MGIVPTAYGTDAVEPRYANDAIDADAIDAAAIDDRDDDDFERRQRSLVRHAVKFGRIALLLVVIWALTGGPFWPIWPIAFLALGVGRRAVAMSEADTRSRAQYRRAHHGCHW